MTKSKGDQILEAILALTEEHHGNGRSDLQLVMDSCMAVRLTLEQSNGCEDCEIVATFLQAVQLVLVSTSEKLKTIAEDSYVSSTAATMLRGPHIPVPGKGDKEEAHDNNLKYRKGKLE